jgi:hypothetical protein
VTHFDQDTGSRSALMRSTDGGLTWDPDSLVVVDPADGVQDHNLAMVSQVSSGELIFNDTHLFANLDADGAARLAGEREVLPDRPNRPFDTMAFDSLYMIRSGDNG